MRRPAVALTAVLIAAAGLAPATAAPVPTSGASDSPALAQPKSAPVSGTVGAADEVEVQAQTLTWTADDSTTAYAEAPTEAVAGPTTIVFENSTATGNTSGMQHTLTFDTSGGEYNDDVDVDILAFPSDENDGRWEVEVDLSPGTYQFLCTIPGHGQMRGELVVTEGDGGGDEDTTPPEVTATIDGETDDDGAYVGAATVNLEATDADSDIDTVEYQLDGGDWTAYTDPFEVTEVGEHTLGYRATDTAGNTSEVAEETFTVVEGEGEDVTPPQVELTLNGETNADGAYLGSAEAVIEATDGNSGVDTVEYLLDDGEWTAYAEPVVVDEVGDHTISYRATDVAGNTSEVAEQTFTVVQSADEDTEAPEVTASLAGEMNESWAYVESVTMTVEATDDGSGIDTIEYATDGDNWTEYTEPVVVDDPGEYAIAYRATDAAGNVSEAAEATFTVVAPSTPSACPNPDPSPTVVMGTIGSGVLNRVAEGDCTIDDLIADEAHWNSHPAFITHVTTVLNRLRDNGIVSGGERSSILTAARQSAVGRS